MEITPYHAKYYSYELTKRCASNSIEKLAVSLSDAQVDLNPHQVEAALFAFRSPLSKGAILADEVGLGKTIEAGIVISQRWAERKHKILIIVPSSLRKQWNQELLEKFFLQSIILDAKSFNQEIKKGKRNPFNQSQIVICSYHFALSKEPYINQMRWNLVVIDEAHKLRNVYKPSNKIGKSIKKSLEHIPKILLTATPLQNSLLELFGLVSIIDDYTFGDIKSFKSQFARLTNEDNFDDLKERLNPICKRTLRRQVQEYIKYTNRIPITQQYTPTHNEQELYNLITEYLRKPKLFALPASQRHLMTLILRKLLASSSFAISGTLDALVKKLENLLKNKADNDTFGTDLSEDLETLDDIIDEWTDEDFENDEHMLTYEEIERIKEEIKLLREYQDIALSIKNDSKGEVLIKGLEKGFDQTEKLGGKRKALIFTESRRTQQYLFDLLQNTIYSDKIVLFNGSNNDQKSKEIYGEWLDKYKNTDRYSGSKSADMRTVLVDYFKNSAEIMIATEAASEGINLQFCSLVVNYDLPWNPQRIEQRIGRCHRYGQKFDVVVVNFLNSANAADQRVYQLLSEKFKLFEGVFGASDEVLGSLESGVDFEKRIIQIYQNCRTKEEIDASFDELQNELETQIDEKMKITRQNLLENFDEEVIEKLKVNLVESRKYLNKYESWLWLLTQYFLKPYANFDTENRSFYLHTNPFETEKIHPGPYEFGKHIEEANIYRIGHPLAKKIIEKVKTVDLDIKEVIFDYSNTLKKITILENLLNKSGWLIVVCLTINSFETEDYIIFSGMCDDGMFLDDDQCYRFFSLPASESSSQLNFGKEIKYKLYGDFKKKKNSTLNKISKKNSVYFEEELDKLDKWGDDKRNSLRLALKELEDAIKELKKVARLAPNLPEKLKFEKERRKLEKKRDDAWREYDGAARNIEKQKDSLIDEIEKKLKQRVSENTLFTIKWRLI